MKRKNLVILIAVLSVVLAALVATAIRLPGAEQDPTLQTGPSGSNQTSAPSTQPEIPTDPSTEPTKPTNPTQPTQPTEPSQPTEPTEPSVYKETTATIGATGDILLHDKVIRSGYDKTDDSFDYSYMFRYFGEYTAAVDYAIANLEVTLIQKPGSNGLKGYNGYPRFNVPDEIVDALKGAGFDMLLTANNHSYDSGHDGFIRTIQVVRDKGLANIGTYLNTEEKRYQIVDINGIRIGMINYTYTYGFHADGTLNMNSLHMPLEDAALINYFDYDKLSDFYAQLQSQLDAMRAEGAEATVLYIHWGNEYVTTPNSWQERMSQALCNMGIDVIVGNHAHVPQPVELLTNENDATKKTLCLYSTGNAVSNISRDDKDRPKNTEDGMLFTFTFAKYSDGTVLVESADILPTWVWRHDVDGVRKFDILTLDDAISDWQTHLGVSEAVAKECRDSYDRTMGIVGDGLDAANAWLAQNQADTEAVLGVNS